MNLLFILYAVLHLVNPYAVPTSSFPHQTVGASVSAAGSRGVLFPRFMPVQQPTTREPQPIYTEAAGSIYCTNCYYLDDAINGDLQ